MRNHKKRKIIIGIVLFVVAIGIIAVVVSVRGKDKQKKETVRQSTISLGKMDLVKSISATGTIESKNTKSVTASIKDTTVQIEKLFVSVGDEVKEGDRLLTFEKSTLEEALREAKDNLSDVRSNVNREISNANKQLNSAIETRDEDKSKQTSNVSAAKKEMQTAEKAVSKAEKQLKSIKDEQQKTIAQETLDKAQETLKQAEAAYNNAVESKSSTSRQNETSVENAKNAVENAKSNGNKSIKEAEKQVEAAEESLNACSVTAPIDGIITAVNVGEGDSYSGGDLFQIQDVSSYVVSTSIDEYDISDVAVGQKVVILTEATDEDELEGEITFIAPSKASSTASQTGDIGSSASSSDGYEVKIALKTENERLRLDMTAKCSIVLEEVKDVFAVPYDAVHEGADGTYINCESGNSLVKIDVTQGMESDYYVEISGSDLYEGMKIIIPTDEIEETSDGNNKDSMFPNDMAIPGGADSGNRNNMGGGNPGGMGVPHGERPN